MTGNETAPKMGLFSVFRQVSYYSSTTRQQTLDKSGNAALLALLLALPLALPLALKITDLLIFCSGNPSKCGRMRRRFDHLINMAIIRILA
jgi:hypothetical protein